MTPSLTHWGESEAVNVQSGQRVPLWASVPFQQQRPEVWRTVKGAVEEEDSSSGMRTEREREKKNE